MLKTSRFYGTLIKISGNKDEKKLMSIKNRGYDVMVIWESEYLENPEDTVKKIEDFLYDKN